MANEVRFVIEDLKRQLREMRERAERAERLYAVVERGLIPLCPCRAMNPSDYDGPQRECVIHGDGDTFVAEHLRLRKVERRAHEWLIDTDLEHPSASETALHGAMRDVLESGDR